MMGILIGELISHCEQKGWSDHHGITHPFWTIVIILLYLLHRMRIPYLKVWIHYTRQIFPLNSAMNLLLAYSIITRNSKTPQYEYLICSSLRFLSFRLIYLCFSFSSVCFVKSEYPAAPRTIFFWFRNRQIDITLRAAGLKSSRWEYSPIVNHRYIACIGCPTHIWRFEFITCGRYSCSIQRYIVTRYIAHDIGKNNDTWQVHTRMEESN